eukprot:277973-Pyramimonas_sp.AAC.1
MTFASEASSLAVRLTSAEFKDEVWQFRLTWESQKDDDSARGGSAAAGHRALDSGQLGSLLFVDTGRGVNLIIEKFVLEADAMCRITARATVHAWP